MSAPPDDLIARLEQAEEGNRDFDLEIMNAIRGKYPWRWLVRGDSITCDEYGPGAPGNPVYGLEYFTESLDGAVMSVPRGYARSVHYSDSCGGEAWLYPPNNDADVQFHGAARTDPLALCIAALKARQS